MGATRRTDFKSAWRRSHLPQKESTHRGLDVRLFPGPVSVCPYRAPATRHYAGMWSDPHSDPPGRSAISEPNHRDRKSTRLNSSHTVISYAVFCLKKKKKKYTK